jgi:hypothetical protein
MRLYQKTGDLYLVQRALGHRQIATTEIHARVGDEQLRRAIRIVSCSDRSCSCPAIFVVVAVNSGFYLESGVHIFAGSVP